MGARAAGHQQAIDGEKPDGCRVRPGHLIWERGNVIVIAMQRGATVTEGVLSVTYRPISKTIPKEPTGGEVPF
jgi:hypothetical protein